MTRRYAVAVLAVFVAVSPALAACPHGSAPTGPTVRVGDRCSVDGAVGRTNRGERVVCARHKGLDYDTWGSG